MSSDLKKAPTKTRAGKGPKKAVSGRFSEDTHLWDIKECANYLGLTVNRVRTLVRDNHIPWTTLNGTYRPRFVPSLIRRWAVDSSLENYDPPEVSR